MKLYILLFFTRILIPANRVIYRLSRKSLCSAAIPALLLVLLQAHAAEAGWPVSAGTASANTQTMAMATDASGNVYIAGYFDGATCTFGSVTLTRIGSNAAFVVKLDASGTVVWAKKYGGSGANTYGYSVAVDDSGNVYLRGNFDTASLTTPALTKIGATDTFVLKLDSTGATTWAKNFGGSGATTGGRGIAVDGSGNVYLAGDFNATLSTPSVTRFGAVDAFALKLDSTGATTWAKKFGGSGASAHGMDIAVDGSGYVYLGGYFDSASLTTPALTKIGLGNAFALKLDSTTGDTTWAKNFGGSGAAYARGQGIAVDGSGNVYLGGDVNNADLTTPPLTKFGGSYNYYAFALKLDSTGTTTWAKNFGGSGASAYGQGIAVDRSGYVYLGGYFDSAGLTTPALTLKGGQDAFALKLDSNGDTTWAKNFGGSGASARFLSITVDGSDAVYPGGYFNAANLTTPALAKIGLADAFALKLASNNNGNLLTLPPPTVTGINPTSGTTAGGTSVTLTGTGFVTGATVTIGGTAATGVIRNSATSISANTPAGSTGAKNVVVTNPDTQTGTLTNGFTFAVPVAIAIADLNDTVSYLIGSGTKPIDQGTAASVTGTDVSNFNTGTLTVVLSTGGSITADQLGIRTHGLIVVSVSDISWDGTPIGTFTGGTGGTPLVVTFNSSATQSAVSELLTNITYANASLANAAQRTINITVSNGIGGTSPPITATINLTRPGFHVL